MSGPLSLAHAFCFRSDSLPLPDQRHPNMSSTVPTRPRPRPSSIAQHDLVPPIILHLNHVARHLGLLPRRPIHRVIIKRPLLAHNLQRLDLRLGFGRGRRLLWRRGDRPLRADGERVGDLVRGRRLSGPDEGTRRKRIKGSRLVSQQLDKSSPRKDGKKERKNHD